MGVIPLIPISERTCGSCSLCCTIMGVPGVKKEAGEPCAFMTPGGGCDVYAKRPRECHDWACGWRSEAFVAGHDPALRPDRAHALLTRARDGEHWLLIEEPAHPGVGRGVYAEAIAAYLAEDPLRYVLVTGGGPVVVLGNLATYYEWTNRIAVAEVAKAVLMGTPMTLGTSPALVGVALAAYQVMTAETA